MTNRIAIIVLLGISLGLYSGCRSQEQVGKGAEKHTTLANGKVLYALKLTKGQSYDMRIGTKIYMPPPSVPKIKGQSSDIRIDTKVDKEPTLRVNTDMVYRFNVKSIDDLGIAMVDCTVNRVKVSQKLGYGQDVDYDSADENKQVIPKAKGMDDIAYAYARSMRAYLDSTFTVKIMPCGQVLEIVGADIVQWNVSKKLMREMGREISSDRTEAGIAGWGEEVLRHLFLNPLPIYSKQPIGPGDSWTRNEKVPDRDKQGATNVTDSYKHEWTWTLKERKAGMATIKVDEQLIKEADPTVPVWSSHGTLEIDEATGRILHSTTRQETSSQGGVTVTTFEMAEAKVKPDK